MENKTITFEELESDYSSIFDTETNVLRGDISIQDNGDIRIGDTRVEKDRYDELLAALKIPKGYGEMIPKTLMKTHLDYLVNDTDDGLEVSVDKNGIVQTYKPHRLPFTLSNLLKTLGDITHSTELAPYSSVGPDKALLYTIDRPLVTSPKVGQTICGGLGLYAEITGKVEAFPFTFTLACSNGAIHCTQHTVWKRKKDQPYTQWFNEIGEIYREETGAALEYINQLTQRHIDHSMTIDKFLDTISQYVFISVAERKSLITKISESQVEDMYDIWNVVTRHLTYAPVDPWKHWNYLKYGGAVADEVGGGEVSFCGTCGRPVVNVN